MKGLSINLRTSGRFFPSSVYAILLAGFCLFFTTGSSTYSEELPRMLVIGDSISMNYTPLVRDRLEAELQVKHIGTNGAHTRNGLKNLEEWLGENSWDFIHFNWGLHDLRRRGGREAVPIDEYEENLRQLVRQLQETGAYLIWATTTPVPQGSSGRSNERAIAYNEIARRVMEEKNIEINDLYALVLPRKEEWMRQSNVHFHMVGYEALADEIVHVLRPHLEPRKEITSKNESPEIQIMFPDDDDLLGPEVTVQVRVRNFALSQGEKGFRLYLNGLDFGAYHDTKPIPLSGLLPGKYRIRVVLIDRDGSETDISDQRYFTVTAEPLEDEP